jgi:hypothetical protein
MLFVQIGVTRMWVSLSDVVRACVYVGERERERENNVPGTMKHLVMNKNERGPNIST